MLGPNNGEYITDRNGRIVISDLTPGTTITAKETKTAAGYVLDTTPQSILIKSGVAQALTFFNKAEGGLELIKVSASDKSQRIPNVTFEIRKMDGASRIFMAGVPLPSFTFSKSGNTWAIPSISRPASTLRTKRATMSMKVSGRFLRIPTLPSSTRKPLTTYSASGGMSSVTRTAGGRLRR